VDFATPGPTNPRNLGLDESSRGSRTGLVTPGARGTEEPGTDILGGRVTVRRPYVTREKMPLWDGPSMR
jgi:hypothetical protein